MNKLRAIPPTDYPSIPDIHQDTSTDGVLPGVPLSEAARILGVSRDAIRQRIRRGSIAAVKVNGTWLVHLDAKESVPPVRTGVDGRTDGRTDNQSTDRGSRLAATSHMRAATPPHQHDHTHELTYIDALYQELVAQLRGEVAFLRNELCRRDALIANLAAQPNAPSQPVPPTAPIHASVQPPRRQPLGPWWARLWAAVSA